MIEAPKNLENLPPYIFGRIKTLTQEAAAARLDVIDLSMGNPDLPTPQPIVDRLVDTIRKPFANPSLSASERNAQVPQSGYGLDEEAIRCDSSIRKMKCVR